MQAITVVLADDHPAVRSGTRQYLEEDDRIRVVAEARTGEEALAAVAAHMPSVAILDIQMPGMSGVDAGREIKSRYPAVRVLLLSAFDDDPYVFSAMRAGVDGYLLKTTGIEELISAVLRVAAGATVLDPAVAARAASFSVSGRPAGAREQVEPLSDRELDVLRLAGRGLTNKAIARDLRISDRTVQGHLASIYGKLQVSSRTQAVMKAALLGWITIDS
jgi:DNA-binding NarL/FixJ family response regulator